MLKKAHFELAKEILSNLTWVIPTKHREPRIRIPRQFLECPARPCSNQLHKQKILHLATLPHSGNAMRGDDARPHPIPNQLCLSTWRRKVVHYRRSDVTWNSLQAWLTWPRLLWCNAYIAITLAVVNFRPLYVYNILVLMVFLLSMWRSSGLSDCMGLAVIRSPWRSGRVPAPHCIHVEYLSALPALTAVAVAKQSLVASNATY